MYIEQHSRYQNKANNIQLRYDDKQFHTTVIKDVLLWIEHNLDQSLLLDDVANKAGYTKWYFQRLFKKVTGTYGWMALSCELKLGMFEIVSDIYDKGRLKGISEDFYC